MSTSQSGPYRSGSPQSTNIIKENFSWLTLLAGIDLVFKLSSFSIVSFMALVAAVWPIWTTKSGLIISMAAFIAAAEAMLSGSGLGGCCKINTGFLVFSFFIKDLNI